MALNEWRRNEADGARLDRLCRIAQCESEINVCLDILRKPGREFERVPTAKVFRQALFPWQMMLA